MSEVEMRETWINDRWPLLLPLHRHLRDSWPWWEAGRLASMWHHLASKTRGECDGCGGMVASTGGFVNAQNGEVVYDVGSEEGDFPALFSSWGCDVVLFEPNDRVWPNIKAIWEANELRPPLAMWAGFAGPDDDGSVRITRSSAGFPLPDLIDGWIAAADGPVIADHGFCNLSERPDIPRISIDEMARWIQPPTAITIDVEGAEFEVLCGAQQTLREHKPKVWVSIHPEFARDMYGWPDVLWEIQNLMNLCGYPDDGRGVFIAADHESHWMWLP